MGRKQRLQRCSTEELKHVLLDPAGGRFIRPFNPYDEVYPGILVGDVDTALSTILLKEMGVTHVLNAAHGRNEDFYGGFVKTGASYYERAGIKFLGIPALDTPSFYLKPYFHEATDFIENCIKAGGKVLVHCQCGISRSTALVAAFLMMRRGMTVQQALSTIRSKRSVFPNYGFLSQLADLDYDLQAKGQIDPSSYSENNRSSTKKDLTSTSYPHLTSDKRYLDMPYTMPYKVSTSPDNINTFEFDRRNYDIDVRYRSRPPHRSRSEERNFGKEDRDPLPHRSYRSTSVDPIPLVDYDYDEPEEPILTRNHRSLSITSDPGISLVNSNLPYKSGYLPRTDTWTDHVDPYETGVVPRYTSSYRSSSISNLRDPYSSSSFSYSYPRSTYSRSVTGPVNITSSYTDSHRDTVYMPKRSSSRPIIPLPSYSTRYSSPVSTYLAPRQYDSSAKGRYTWYSSAGLRKTPECTKYDIYKKRYPSYSTYSSLARA